MPGPRLRDAIGREREGEAADGRRADAEAQRAQPEKREPAGAQVPEQEEGVPRADGPEEGVQRPERESERPAGEVQARLGLRPEAVGVAPRNLAAAELVAREPELPDRLQMVTGRRGTRKAAKPLGQEVVVGVLQRGPGRNGARAEVEGYDEGDKARAAAISSSRSGTSESS